MLREEVNGEEVKSEEVPGEKEDFSHSDTLPTQNSKLTHGQVFVSTKSLVRVEEF
jgi:hypothetical protein